MTRARIPDLKLSGLWPIPDQRAAAEMAVIDRLPFNVRKAVHEHGVKVVKEYMHADFTHIKDEEDAAAYEDFTE